MRTHEYYVYIVTNKSWTLYTGVTNDLTRRLWEHKHGTVKGFTSRYRIGKLLYYETLGDIRDAIAREKQIKGWTRARKMALVKAANPSGKNLSEGWFQERDTSLRSVMTDKSKRSFVVLGGVGAIGRVVVRDLFESHLRNHILIADYNEACARAYARSFRGRRVLAAFADAGEPKELAKLFRGHTVVINCTQHDFNLKVMRAALAAKVHYVDLGGLFHWTRRQLKLNRQFKRAGLTAVLGAGCSPGITNVMTRAATDRLNHIESVWIRVGARDMNAKPADFSFPYSAQTIVEELTLKPWVFAHGKFREVKPRTGWERVGFSRPVGAQWVVLTRHSEVATIPLTFREKGLRECDFKVGFDRKFVREVVKRLKAGWTARDFAKLPAPRRKPNDYEVSRVIVRGDNKTITMDCHARAKRSWHASAGDVDTGCPPSIIAQMIATGVITQRGVLPPEVAVPVEPFFLELRKRGMKIVVKESKR